MFTYTLYIDIMVVRNEKTTGELKMKGYIYNVDTMEIIALIEGVDNNDIECKANELGYMGVDEYGLTYSDSGLV